MTKISKLLDLKNLATYILLMSLLGCADSFDTSYFEKEISDPTIGVGLKIGHTTYTAKELFEEIGDDIEVSETSTNGKSLVSFVYSETIKETNTADFLELSNKNSGEKFNLTVFPNETKGTYRGPDIVIQDSKPLFSELKPDNDAKLTDISFSEGTFQIFLTNNIDTDVEVEFTLNSFIKDGAPFVQTFNLSRGQLTQSSSSIENLNEYTVNLAYGTNGYNTLATNIKASMVVKDGETFTNASSVSYNIEFRGVKVKSAKGDLGKEELDIETKVFDLTFFEELSEGNISFESPRLKVNATNGYGFPVGITLNGITTNAATNNQLFISKEDSNIKLRSETLDTDDYYAIINASEIEGTNKRTNIEINNQNSNLADLLNEKPKKFNINVDAISNPNSITNNNNFFDVDNRVDVELEVELPLHVTFDNLSFEPNPFEIDTEEFDDIEDSVTTLTLEVLTKNTIPLNGDLEIQFITTQGSTETVKFVKNVKNAIDGASIDSDGFSEKTLDNVLEKTKYLNLTVEEIKTLSEVTHIKTLITFDTTNKQAVKIQSTDSVTFNIALLADYTFSNQEENTNN